MDLTDKDHIVARLEQAGAWSKKRFGQHFLLNSQVIWQAIEIADITSNDTVVEIGPGLGVLTEQLLKRAGRVVAFELDREMLQILQEDFSGLELIPGDVLKTAREYIPGLGKYKVVANIPYQITTPLLRMFLEGEGVPRPVSLTLLMQKEVGKRLAATEQDSERRYLSVLAQYFAEVSYITTVKPEEFWPAPEVDSALIYLKLREERLLPEESEKEFFKFVHSLFLSPRKQLKNVVAGIRGVESEEVVKYFVSRGLPSTARAQELSVEQWVDLFLHPMK